MSDRAFPSTRWAILVGVGLNIDTRDAHGPKDRSLKGAVADVLAIKGFLEASFPEIDINCLTASKSSNDPALGNAQESKDRLATRKNVASALARVINLGNPGDHVYFHFSGHGVRRDQDGAVALALYSGNTSGIMYFLGHYLRDYLHQMQEKSLLVTLVLDCCFSGSVLRYGELHGVRSLEYDNYIAELSEEEHMADSHFSGRLRDVSLTLNQLLRNESHIIIAACGPYEYASEITAGGASRGALSFVLLDALTSLKRAGAKVTHRSLYQSLRARFHIYQQSQTPLLFGTQKESFFAEIETSGDALEFIPVYRQKDSGSLILDAGQAHGIHEDDEYVAYPFASDESTMALTSYNPVKLKVLTVEALTSYLGSDEGTDVIDKDSTWKAQLITSFTDKRIWIRLPRDLPNLDALLTKAEGHHYLGLSTNEPEEMSYVFQVQVTDDTSTAFVIENLLSTRVPNVPRVPVDRFESVDYLIRLMGHLATFKYIESLENRMPDPQFENSFSLTCDSLFGDQGYYDMTEGESLYFNFKNKDATDSKYITILNFKSNWGIDNLGNGNWLIVPPMNDHRLKLDMSLPKHIREAGGNESEDILKVIVTNQSASFPAVPLRPIHDEVLRDDFDGPDKLLDSLRSMTRDRGSRWATRTFFSRTHRN